MTNSIQDRPTESLTDAQLVLTTANPTAGAEGDANTAGADPTQRSWTARLVQFLKTLKQQVISQWQARSASRQEHYQHWQDQAKVVDEKLTERYGDRYTTVKETAQKTIQEKADAVTTWYTTPQAGQDMPISDVLHQKQTELEAKLGEAESFMTQQEQKIRKQLKDLLQTTASKL
jgi:Tfp pilus assembly major pilin PilA